MNCKNKYVLEIKVTLEDNRYCNGCSQLKRNPYESFKLEYYCPYQYHDYLERQGDNIVRAKDCPLKEV
jgi:hypothetical protein